MNLEYPSFDLTIEHTGSSLQGYVFMISLGNQEISTSTMVLIPYRSGFGPKAPPTGAVAAAGQHLVSDLRKLLSIGVDAFVDERMIAERRVTRRDAAEATELATHHLEVAQALDEQDLAAAEKDLSELAAGGRPKKRRRPEMGKPGEPRTAGARQLAAAGFTDIHEISLVGKGPGLWYEATEPPPKWSTPHDWSPRGETRDRALLLRQGQHIWHAFFRYSATGSGSDPFWALKGGLGDVIDTDAQLERYCELVLAAPRRLSEDYSGLYEAQGQCYNSRQEDASR